MRPIAQLPAAAAAWMLIAGVVAGLVTDFGDLVITVAVLLFAVSAPWCWPLWVAVVSHAAATVWLLSGALDTEATTVPVMALAVVMVSIVAEGAGLRWLAKEDGDRGLANLVAGSYLLTVAFNAGMVLMVWAPGFGGMLMVLALPAAVVRIIALWRLARRFAS